MTTMRMAGAASGCEKAWHNIDWTKAHQTVRRLQMRMAKAVREGRWGKVKPLQWLLTHSFYGKAIAVKRVTENQGKKTLGVDEEIWTPRKRPSELRPGRICLDYFSNCDKRVGFFH